MNVAFLFFNIKKKTPDIKGKDAAQLALAVAWPCANKAKIGRFQIPIFDSCYVRDVLSKEKM